MEHKYNIAFTGSATIDGVSVNRSDLTDAAVKAGFVVRHNVDATVRYLVSSKLDTKKAIAAVNQGVEVISYAKFGELLKIYKVHILKNGNSANPYVTVNLDEYVPDFTRLSYGELL